MLLLVEMFIVVVVLTAAAIDRVDRLWIAQNGVLCILCTRVEVSLQISGEFLRGELRCGRRHGDLIKCARNALRYRIGTGSGCATHSD